MNRISFKGIIIIVIVVCAAILGLMFGMPLYNVWQQEMTGKAEFSRAEQNRKIKVEEAKAEKESAIFRAEAEIERAKGVWRFQLTLRGERPAVLNERLRAALAALPPPSSVGVAADVDAVGAL